MKTNKIHILTFCALCVALNVVLGILTSMLKLPFYLDTIGTVLTSVLAGPALGVCVGILTNIVTGFIYSMKDIPFLLVNVAVALITGFIAKKYNFKVITAIITGIILSIVCPLIGTPIGIWLYGGLTGTGTDFLVIWLKASGNSIFVSSFLPKIFNNLIDKIGTCVIVSLMVPVIPAVIKSQIKSFSKKQKT